MCLWDLQLFLQLFLKLKQTNTSGICRLPLKEKFCRTCSCSGKSGTSQTWAVQEPWWVGWVGRGEIWTDAQFFVTAVWWQPVWRPVRDVGVRVSVSLSLSYPLGPTLPSPSRPPQLLSFLSHHHYWYTMDYVKHAATESNMRREKKTGHACQKISYWMMETTWRHF